MASFIVEGFNCKLLVFTNKLCPCSLLAINRDTPFRIAPFYNDHPKNRQL